MSGIEKFGDDPINVARMHHEIEAGRLAYRDRSLYLADPAFSDVPVEDLLSPAYADQVRGLINPIKHSSICRHPLCHLTKVRFM